MARRLVVDALARSHLPKTSARDLVAYYLRRNAIAYRSHAKRCLLKQGAAKAA